MNKIKNVKSLLQRVEEVTKQKELDLSSGEDLSIGIMNLISIEEHLFFTFNKTKDSKYIDLLDEIRKMRTDLFNFDVITSPKIKNRLHPLKMRVIPSKCKEYLNFWNFECG